MSEKDKHEITANVEIDMDTERIEQLAIELVAYTDIIIKTLREILEVETTLKVTSPVGGSEKTKKFKDDKKARDILIEGYKEHMLEELHKLKAESD